MKEVIITTDMKKEKGFIYFVTYDENQFIQISRTKAGRKHKDEVKQEP